MSSYTRHWLVLQVHYATVSHVPERGDNTTVVMTFGRTPRPKQAGVMLMVTSGQLPPKETTAMEVACTMKEKGLQIHPFAYRVHTHALGVSVQGWKVRDNGKDWKSLGKANPQWPQVFNMIDDGERPALEVSEGDVLAARCTMRNHLNSTVSVGPTASDEMCNFYLMYWAESGRLPRRKFCWSAGPPRYSLAGGALRGATDFGAGLDNVPPMEE